MGLFAVGVLGQRILLLRDRIMSILDDAGDRGVLRRPLALDQQFQRAKAPAAGRQMEPAGFLTLIIKGWPQDQALQEATPGDVVGKRLDRDAGLYAPDIGLGQVDQVERDIPRAAEDELGGSFYHVGYSMTGRRETLSRLQARYNAEGRRSEEQRVGTEWLVKCRLRCAPQQ